MSIDLLRRAGLPRMRPRDPDEPHRATSSLELFFDLTFVVGVSVAAERLVEVESLGDWSRAVFGYVAVFFALWWGWVNFTWFASAFDTDDWLYRITTIVQMGGVLVVAGGIQAAFEQNDYRLIVVGYIVMRLAMTAQWLRAARSTEYRTTALRYAGAIAVVQMLWVLRLLVPISSVGAQVASFVVLAGLELLVPAWAERTRRTPFNPRHIGERYGLFTLIVLGEGLLSVTHALIEAEGGDERSGGLVLLGATALVLIAGMWWIYFAREPHDSFSTVRSAFSFGYLHWMVFAAAAALASGLELGLGHGGEVAIPETAVRAAATVPVSLFLLATWLVILRPSLGAPANRAVFVLAVLAGAAALLPSGVQWCALAVVAIVLVLELDQRRPRDTVQA